MTENQEWPDLVERLSALLTGVADALKGKPEPNTAHSWHDLPQLAAKAAAALRREGADRD
jgi:hypothetical protein